MTNDMPGITPERLATNAGIVAGWHHANYAEAYGPVADTECPPWYVAHKTYWQAGYDEGKELFENERYVDGSLMDGES